MGWIEASGDVTIKEIRARLAKEGHSFRMVRSKGRSCAGAAGVPRRMRHQHQDGPAPWSRQAWATLLGADFPLALEDHDIRRGIEPEGDRCSLVINCVMTAKMFKAYIEQVLVPELVAKLCPQNLEVR